MLVVPETFLCFLSFKYNEKDNNSRKVVRAATDLWFHNMAFSLWEEKEECGFCGMIVVRNSSIQGKNIQGTLKVNAAKKWKYR